MVIFCMRYPRFNMKNKKIGHSGIK
jgi:hypothetical protein